MGADQSIVEQPICPQMTPICATEPRFCLPHNVQLHLKEKYSSMSGRDFKVMDADNMDVKYFQSEGRLFSLSSRTILKDYLGAPVLERCNNKVIIYSSEGRKPRICKFDSFQSTYLKPTKVSTVFPDVLNGGIERRFVLKCGMNSKSCLIYLGDPKQDGVPIAHIFSPHMRQCGNDFIMEVAANVDIAICSMMCIDLVARR